MDKATLIADEPGTRLHFKDSVIVLERPDQRHHRIGLKAIKQIVVKGDVDLSSKLLDACLAAGVSIIILPGQRREPARHLFPQAGGALAVRLAQYAAFLDPGQRLTLAQAFVTSKIEAQAECLRQHGVELPLERFVSSARTTHDIAALMGVEGAATARYFSHWSALLDPDWGFKGRNRRPPRDPVNALLSLGYTLACQAVGRLAAQHGFEAALGFLHAPAPGRPSLALDLVEPLRPWVDEWILTVCSDGGFRVDDFVTDPTQGCRLKKAASGNFFHRWYSTAEHWLEHLARGQLGALQDSLASACDFRPA